MEKIDSMRIGNNLDNSSNLIRKPYFGVNYDNLSAKVFDADLIPSKVNDCYINTSFVPIGPSDHFENEIFNDLGFFERQLLSKLLNPVKKVLFLCGGAGCGKTTTIHYLNNLIKTNLKDDVGNFFFPIILDLNSNKYKNISEKQARELLYQEICSNLRGLINLHHLINLETELIDFWDVNFDKARNEFLGYSVFIWLAEKLESTDKLSRKNPNFKSLFASRKKLFSLLQKDDFYNFNYLMQLWGFIFETLDVKLGSYIIFDNIDSADLVVQSALLSIVNDAIYDSGPHLLISLRPETFLSHNIRKFRNSKVVDRINHPGFLPSVVIIDRLNKFINDPISFYNKDDGLSKDQFIFLTNFMKTISDIFTSNQGYKHTNFLNAACGDSLRQALVLAQKYFKISAMEFNDGKLSAHTLNRIVVVNHGEEQRHENHRYFIPNLFELKELKNSARLIKLRILNYLYRKSDKSEEHINIRMEMKGFGYSETKEVKLALSDLLDYSSALLITNGLDSYNTEEEFLRSSKDIITLSEKGVGYIDHIIYNLDYIQEIILDCYMPSHWINKKIRFSNIPEKFTLLLNFLNYLYEIDLTETKYYLTYYNIDHYRDIHGKSLITIPLINNSCNAIYSIFSSILASGDVSLIRNYEAPLQSAAALLYNAKNQNEKLLGFTCINLNDTFNSITDALITNFPKYN